MLEDHEFHPKLGLKSGERAPKLFVAQVLAAAQLAGHVGRSWPARPSAGYTGATEWLRCVPQSDAYTVVVRAG
jgi:hypothetical protein